MFSKLRSLIFKIDPETAHNLVIKSLKLNLTPNLMDEDKDDSMFKSILFGKEIDNPIGMAAGFDKNAEVYNSLFKLGFGFVEVGTVTPLKQYGNSKPRVFRLVEDQALINRLGFNNLIGYAIKYFNDVIKLQKKYKKPDISEKLALEALVKTLNDCNDEMLPEDIQTLIYSTGKENGYSENLRDWFKLIYEVVFGDENGPRMGFFISFFGVKETKKLITEKIK